MTKIFTFKKRKDFLRVAKGDYVVAHNVIVQAAPSLSAVDNIMVGYTATKRLGNAVVRNRCKRRLRAVVLAVLKQYALAHIDYVFIARQTTAECNFQELQRDMIYAVKKINKNFMSSFCTSENEVSSDEASI